MAAQGAGGKFGDCCENLKDAMQGEDFEPLIAAGGKVQKFLR